MKPNRDSRHDVEAFLAGAVEEMKKDANIIGAFCFSLEDLGTLVDGYVVAVTKEPGMSRRRKYIGAHALLIIERSLQQLTADLAAKRSTDLTESIARGRIVFSRDDLLEDIKSYAASILEDKGPPKTSGYSMLEAESMEANLEEIDRALAAGDEANAAYLMDWLVYRVGQAFFLWRDRVLPRPYDLRGCVAEVDPEAYVSLTRYFESRDLAEKRTMVDQLTRRVVGHFGGFPKGTFEEVTHV